MLEKRKLTKSEAARLGGLARQAKYGNLGTEKGRSLGGLRSQITHSKKNTGFYILKKIQLPKRSKKLAELCGILAGDGHVGVYQTSMTTNSLTDVQHALYVQKLFEGLFKISASIIKKKSCNAVVVVISSKTVCQFLSSLGLTSGNKVHAQLDVPSWICKNKSFRKAFLRGLFDTDGCVYVDNHTVKGKLYRNIGIAFTNRSLPFLSFFKSTLELSGFHPTQKSRFIVFLRRESEILRYFEHVGSSNQKHLHKLDEYLKQKGRVPKRS